MTVDQGAGQQRPAAADIAAVIRAAIDRGDYRPGSAVPSETQLVRDYGVAKATARRALELLVNEGLIVPRRGAGMFVREFRPIVRNGIGRLTSGRTWTAGRSIWDEETLGRELRVDQIRVSRDEPPGWVRALLSLPDEEDLAAVRRRRFVLDGKPVLLAASWLPVSIVAGSQIEQEDTGPGGTYARLAELGYRPVRFREDLRARMPRPTETETLALDPGTPVIEITRTAYTEEGRPVEVNDMTADAAAYVMRYDFGLQG